MASPCRSSRLQRVLFSNLSERLLPAGSSVAFFPSERVRRAGRQCTHLHAVWLCAVAAGAGPTDAVNSYRVVLTPSCDLVVGGNRTPVDEVLVARCVSVTDQEILRRNNLQAASPQKIGKNFCGDSHTDMVVLPKLHGAWPTSPGSV